METDGPRPNLFIIGAMKSGTTSLHASLGSHPDVFMCEPKEPGFFVPELDYYPKEERWYRGLFAEAGNARIIGESSTHYAKFPVYRGVPERIAEYSPDARFIYLVRDPVERAISHYWHHVGKLEEHRTMLQAVRDDVRYVAFSDYRMQLEPYFDTFGRDRVRVLSFEEMVRKPHDVLAGVFSWLGVDPGLWRRDFAAKNARPEELKRLRGRGFMRRFATGRLWGAVSPLIPRRLKDAGRGIAVERVEPMGQPPEEAVRYLRTVLAERARELEALLGTEFPEWTTTFPERTPTRALVEV